MDTKGHWEVAKDAGLPLLKEAAKRACKQGWRFEALRLGNWLTDVTQAVDPVAIAAAKKGFLENIDKLFGVVERAVEQHAPKWARPANWKQHLNSRKAEVRAAAGALLKFMEGGQQSDWAKACRSGFRFHGYFKFVHPKKKKGSSVKPRARMDFQAYIHVFNSRYTQYYPHAHLDRFPDDLSKEAGYSKDLAGGTRTPKGRGAGAPNLTPHMYKYLVDYIERVAAVLADVDLNWAGTTFSPTATRWTSDSDKLWNEYLAKLGHAMHVLEDFFAHSNFIELALNQHSDQAKLVPKEDEWWFGDSPWEIFTKRITKCTGPKLAEMKQPRNKKELKALPPERNVVTGYFDFKDTFCSLRHVGEEMFGGGRGEFGDWKKIGKLVRDTVEGVQKRQKNRSFNSKAEAFAAARADAKVVLLELVSKGDPDVKEAAKTVSKEVPEQIRDDFLDCVAWFSMKTPGVGITMYDAYVKWSEFVEKIKKPLALITWLLGQPPKWLKTVAKTLQDLFAKPIQRAMDEYIGRYRIGCHSLVAKDYPWSVPELEWADKVFEYALNCAKALHWCVIKTMTRWSEPSPLFLSRAEPKPPDQTCQKNVTNTFNLIDWRELVEFFLRHPHGKPGPAEKKRWWEPVVRLNQWSSLHGYNGTAAGRSPNLRHSLCYVKHTQEVKNLIEVGNKLTKAGERRYTPK